MTNNMNRTIKFRGKVLHRKSHQKNEWVYGMPTIFRDGRTAIRWQCSEKAKDPEAWKTQSVEPETLGQFTGLHDKNGKDIYEDDIVNVRQGERTFDIVVKWDNEAMAFMAYYADGNQSPLSWFSDLRMYQLRVIGSIHDNPELLNEK